MNITHWGGEHQGLTHDLPKDHLAPRSTKLWPKTQKQTRKNHENLMKSDEI